MGVVFPLESQSHFLSKYFYILETMSSRGVRSVLQNEPFCFFVFPRHGWNLSVLPNNSGSILRHLGAVPGKTNIHEQQ